MPHHPGRARRMREMPSGALHPPACAFTPFKETRRGMGGLHRLTGRPPCAWAAVSPRNQRLPARDPDCGERPSPLSTARLLSPLLSDLLSSTLFAECCFSARQNPMKTLTDPLWSSSLKESSKVAQPMLFIARKTAPHAFAKAPLSADGLKPSKSSPFTSRKENIEVPRKHYLCSMSWKVQDAQTPLQPITCALGTSGNF